MPADSDLTRELPLVPEDSALLIVDVQNLCARRDGGEFKERTDAEIARDYAEYFAGAGRGRHP